MNNVFPEDMGDLDYDDIKKSLQTIENYIRYIEERVDHSINTVSKKTKTDIDNLSKRVKTLEGN